MPSTPPKGAMSSPYGNNVDNFAKMAMDALDRAGTQAHGKFGDAPKKHTELPKSEQDELLRLEQLELENKKIIEQKKTQEDTTQKILAAEKEKMRLEFELEYQKKLNDQLMKLIKEDGKTSEKLILG